jgi:IS605 OrfB family transposase
MILTYKYRIKDKSARKALRAYAWGCNQIWNYAVALQRDCEARYRAGAPKRRWASHFDLTMLTTGVSTELGIRSDTIGEVCRTFAVARDAARRAPRFRASGGRRRALGWVPFKGRFQPMKDGALVYLGKPIRVFGTKSRPLPPKFKSGAFVEDAQGRWWLTLQCEVQQAESASTAAVGIDLGLKTVAHLSDGSTVEALRSYREYEHRLGVAQRAGNKRRTRAIHARIANIRKDHIHKATTRIAKSYEFIAVGNVDAGQLAKTRMAKSVLDAGWSMFRSQLRYKASRHGARFVEVDERFTSQVCSACGTIPASSPKGMGALGMRSWVCSDCGAEHDRDRNAALNILRIGLSAQPHADESRSIARRSSRISATSDQLFKDPHPTQSSEAKADG